MNSIFTPKNRAYEIVSNKFPCYDIIFHEYEVYDITSWKDRHVKKFIEMNKSNRNLKVSTTFSISQEGDDTRRTLLMLSFIRTSITEFSNTYKDNNQDWIYLNTVIRHYFDEVSYDILDYIECCEEYEDDEEIDKFSNIKDIVDDGIEAFIEDFNDYIKTTDGQRYPIISEMCDDDYIRFLEKELIDQNSIIYVGKRLIQINIADEDKEEINDILEEYYENLISMDGRLQLMKKKIDNDIFASFKYGKNNRSSGLSVETDYGYSILLTNASDL